MPAKAKTPLATLAVIEEHPTGDRARFTVPVWPTSVVDEVAARAETVRARIEAETGHAVRVVTHAA